MAAKPDSTQYSDEEYFQRRPSEGESAGPPDSGLAPWRDFYARANFGIRVRPTVGQVRGMFGPALREGRLMKESRGSVPSTSSFGRMVKWWSKHVGCVFDRVSMIIFEAGVACYAHGAGDTCTVHGIIGLLDVRTTSATRDIRRRGQWDTDGVAPVLELLTAAPRHPGQVGPTTFVLAADPAETAGEGSLDAWARAFEQASRRSDTTPNATTSDGDAAAPRGPAAHPDEGSGANPAAGDINPADVDEPPDAAPLPLPQPPAAVAPRMPPDVFEFQQCTAADVAAVAFSSSVSEARLLELLERGLDPDARTGDGTPLIVHVARRSIFAGLQLLLAQGADANARDSKGTTALHVASERADSDAARALLACGADPDVGDRGGWTPLQLACARGFTPTVAALLDGGAGMNVQTREHALVLAAGSARLATVRLLLQRGCDPNAASAHDGSTALHAACAADAAEVVTALLQAGACAALRERFVGNQPLHVAASNGAVRAIGALLGARPKALEARTPAKETPLMLACSRGRAAAAELLIARGASVDGTDTFGRSPAKLCATEELRAAVGRAAALRIAGENGRDGARAAAADTGGLPGIDERRPQVPSKGAPASMQAIVSAVWDGQECVVQHAIATGALTRDSAALNYASDGAVLPADDGRGRTLLSCAIEQRRVDVVAALIDAGANPSGDPSAGRRAKPPLIEALESSRWDIARLLLDRGADACAHGGIERAGALYAAVCAPTALLVALLAAGAKVNDAPPAGALPLHRAITLESVTAARWLLDHGAKLELTNAFGQPAEHIALQRDTPVMLEWVLRHGGGDVERRNGRGVSLLQAAVADGAVSHVDAIIAAGAQVDARDADQATAMHYAARAGSNRVQLVRALAGAGADPNARDSAGATALHHALRDRDTSLDTLGALLDAGADPDLGTGEALGVPLASLFAGFATPDDAVARARLLLSRGATATATGGGGQPLLYVAVLRGAAGVVDLLLEHGADVGHRTQVGDSLLHIAASNGHTDVINVLAKRAPQLVDSRGVLGFTPLHCACASDHLAAITALLAVGARSDVPDDGRGLPLERCRSDAARALLRGAHATEEA